MMLMLNSGFRKGTCFEFIRLPKTLAVFFANTYTENI
jgi:hypothetical protein